jgi:hypothetical protein
MSQLELRAVLCLRLLIPFGEPTIERCRLCTLPGEDIFRYHPLSCGGSDADRFRRHETVVKALHNLSHSAGLQTCNECAPSMPLSCQ